MHLCKDLPGWPYISSIICRNRWETESEDKMEFIKIKKLVEIKSEIIKLIYKIDTTG